MKRLEPFAPRQPFKPLAAVTMLSAFGVNLSLKSKAAKTGPFQNNIVPKTLYIWSISLLSVNEVNESVGVSCVKGRQVSLIKHLKNQPLGISENSTVNSAS